MAIILTPLISTPPKVNAQQGGGNIYLPIIMKDNSQSLTDRNESWLALVNSQRAAAGLPPLQETAFYHEGIALHVQYMLYNPYQENVHTEYEGKPGYTEMGKKAAGQSNMVILIGGNGMTEKSAIETMLTSPEHRYHMLHPDLKETGFALQCDQNNCFAGLNVLGSLPASYKITAANIVHPASGQTGIPDRRYPITWSFYIPWTWDTNDADEVYFVSASILDSQGKKVPFQVAEPDHTNKIYDTFNQIVLTPDSDLVSGMTYHVEMMVDHQGNRYQKSFSFSVR